MTREEFKKKVFALTEQLTALVEQLQEIPELDDSLDSDEYDASISMFVLSILGLEQDMDNISDLYFDED